MFYIYLVYPHTISGLLLSLLSCAGNLFLSFILCCALSLRRMGRGIGGRRALMCLHENHFKLLILALSTLCHCQLLCLVFISFPLLGGTRRERKPPRAVTALAWPGLRLVLSSFWLLLLLRCLHMLRVSCVALLLHFFLFFFFLFFCCCWIFFRVIFWNWHLVCDERDLLRTGGRETHLDWAACLALALSVSRHGLVTQWVHSPTRCPAVWMPHWLRQATLLFAVPLSVCRVSLTWLACLSNGLSLFHTLCPLPISCCVCVCVKSVASICYCIAAFVYICYSACVCVCVLQPLTFRLLNDSTISANEIFLQRI